MDREAFVETVVEIVARLTRPMKCSRCGKDASANTLNRCVECGEGFCDRCVPACACGAVSEG